VKCLSQHRSVHIPSQLLFLLRLNCDWLIEVVRLRLNVAAFFPNFPKHNWHPDLHNILLLHGVDHLSEIRVAHVMQVRRGVDQICISGSRVLHAGQLNRVQIAGFTDTLNLFGFRFGVQLDQMRLLVEAVGLVSNFIDPALIKFILYDLRYHEKLLTHGVLDFYEWELAHLL